MSEARTGKACQLLGPRREVLGAGAVSTLTAKDILLDNRFEIRGHGGTSPGAQTIVAYDRAHDTTVAVWCNRLDPGEYELLPSVVAAKETFELTASSGGRQPRERCLGTSGSAIGDDVSRARKEHSG